MRLRMLVSFHYYRDADLDRLCAAFPEPPEVFADSGAFSAHTQGAEIELDEYADWLKRWAHHFTVVSNLDVIRDPAATWNNQRALEDRGFKPLPVFHGGSEWEHLERYLQAGYSYIALGGLVGAPEKGTLAWTLHAFRMARQHDPRVRFHGFGATRLGILKALPWYSVDSSSWGAGHRYGQLSLWDDRSASWVRVKLGDHAQVYAHADLLRLHGGDPAAFAVRDFGQMRTKSVEQTRAERRQIIAVTVAAWVRLEAWLRHHHGPVTPPPGWEEDGPNCYLADTNPVFVGGDFERADLPIAARDVEGPRVFLADARGKGHQAVENADMALAAEDLDGVRIYLADTGAPTDTANILMAANGPKVYMAEGVERNLRAAGDALAGMGDEQP